MEGKCYYTLGTDNLLWFKSLCKPFIVTGHKTRFLAVNIKHKYRKIHITGWKLTVVASQMIPAMTMIPAVGDHHHHHHYPQTLILWYIGWTP